MSSSKPIDYRRARSLMTPGQRRHEQSLRSPNQPGGGDEAADAFCQRILDREGMDEAAEAREAKREEERIARAVGGAATETMRQLINIETAGDYAPDLRRVILDDRMLLQTALQHRDVEAIRRARKEAIHTASLWGLTVT